MNTGYYSRHNLSIPLYLILTIITCGVFNLYWNYAQMEACNDMLEREEFSFIVWLLLGILTCGLYHLYYQYKMGAAIVEIQRREGVYTFDELPLVSLLVTLFGLSIIADCIHQSELNKLAVIC